MTSSSHVIGVEALVALCRRKASSVLTYDQIFQRRIWANICPVLPATTIEQADPCDTARERKKPNGPPELWS